MTPVQRMMELRRGVWVGQVISVFARLGIADVLAGGARTAEEIAQTIDAHGPSVHRLLRALVDPGVVSQDGKRFALTPLGETLRTDILGSLAASVTMVGMPFHRASWSDLYTSIKTGEPAFKRVHGKPLFEYLNEHPDDAAVFDAAMTSFSGNVMSSVLSSYDFSGFARVVDVGGGQGMLLSKVLQANPTLFGVLFDLPHVVAGASPVLEEAGVADRCHLVGGSFFERIPTGADAYLLSNIIHDWDDDRSELILRVCRAAMSDHAVLLIFELLLPDGPEPHPGKLSDLEMFMQTDNGRQRTLSEFSALLQRAGLQLAGVVPGPAGVDIVEARAN